MDAQYLEAANKKSYRINTIKWVRRFLYSEL